MEIIKRKDITDAINEVIADINTILDEEREREYLEGIILLYGLIENILKVTLYYHMILDRFDELAAEEVNDNVISEVHEIFEFIKRLSLYNALRFALSVKLIDYNFFCELNNIRKKRNDVAHQLWLLKNRKNTADLRKELEYVATRTSRLIEILNNLIDEIGLGIEDIEGSL